MVVKMDTVLHPLTMRLLEKLLFNLTNLIVKYCILKTKTIMKVVNFKQERRDLTMKDYQLVIKIILLKHV